MAAVIRHAGLKNVTMTGPIVKASVLLFVGYLILEMVTAILDVTIKIVNGTVAIVEQIWGGFPVLTI